MMKLSSMLSALTLTGSLLCVTALAQTRICLGGDLQHLTKQQKESCMLKAQSLRTVAASLHAPEDWHFVVVCGEEGWKQYAAYAMRQDSDLLTRNSDTNYGERETFLRESAIGTNAGPVTMDAFTREVASILSQLPAETKAGL